MRRGKIKLGQESCALALLSRKCRQPRGELGAHAVCLALHLLMAFREVVDAEPRFRGFKDRSRTPLLTEVTQPRR